MTEQCDCTKIKNDLTKILCSICLTFLSKCLSSRVRASVSPPGHTAEDRPSVSKPAGVKLKLTYYHFSYIFNSLKRICAVYTILLIFITKNKWTKKYKRNNKKKARVISNAIGQCPVFFLWRNTTSNIWIHIWRPKIGHVHVHVMCLNADYAQAPEVSLIFFITAEKIYFGVFKTFLNMNC